MASLNHVASTILEQIGGNEFCVMVGVKSLTQGKDFLGIRWKASAPYNHIEIKLNAWDYYDLTFYKIINNEVVKQETIEDVDCFNLRGVFERKTNLATSLKRDYR